MQVLQLAEEQWRECRVKHADKVRALALIHALVVARRVAIITVCRDTFQEGSVLKDKQSSPKA